MTAPSPTSTEVTRRFDATDYLLDDGTASALYLAAAWAVRCCSRASRASARPTAAKTLAAVLDAPADPAAVLRGSDGRRGALRLELSASAAQHPAVRGARGAASQEADLYTEAYLVERPILQCVRHRGPTPPVLLIDEIDRADDEFEALLLEFLGEAAVTVPELGTFVAEQPPIVVLTSNRSRDLHDALRRRCLYHWIDYPEPARAAAIVRRTVPGATTALIEHATQFVAYRTESRPRQAARRGRDHRLGGRAGRARRRPTWRDPPAAGQPRRVGQDPRRPRRDGDAFADSTARSQD